MEISFTLHDYADLSSPGNPSKFINESFADAPVSVLTSWNEGDDTHLAFGGQDGTVYLWKAAAPMARIGKEPSLSSLTPSLTGRISPPAMPRSSISTSRSTSPSGSSSYASPFHVNQRSRIVSGITAERVEAPKNYVDFDDEPDKLKDMLKGRNPKEKDKVVSPTSDSPTKDANRETSKRKDPPKSLRSPPTSPLLTPLILSTPASPRAAKEDRNSKGTMNSSAHILLPGSNSSVPVSSMHIIYDGKLLVVLQNSGHLTILSTVDGRCASTLNVSDIDMHPPSGAKGGCGAHDIWKWDRIQACPDDERILILAAASRDPKSSFSQTFDNQHDEIHSQCKVVLFILSVSEMAGNLGIDIKPAGQWCVESTPDAVGLYCVPERPFTFFYITSTGQFLTRELHISPQPIHPKASRPQTPDSHSINVTLPNPFRTTKPQTIDQVEFTQEKYGQVALEDSNEVGVLPIEENKKSSFWLDVVDRTLYGTVWSDQGLVAFRYDGGPLTLLFNYGAEDIQTARFLSSETFIVIYRERVEHYTVELVDANNDHVSPPHGQVNYQPRLMYTTTTGSYDVIDVPLRNFVIVLQESEGRRQLGHHRWDDTARKMVSDIVWQAETRHLVGPRLTACLTVDLDAIVLGYSDGKLRQCSLLQLCRKRLSQNPFDKVSEYTLDGFIVHLQVVKNMRTNERVIIGGADDGSVAIWTLADLKLCARWTIFNTPLSRVLQFQDISSGPLRGCILCVAEDGTIAVVAIDGYEFLYMIPGSTFPLERACIGQNNLLLMYSDKRARLWDIKTKEFWRSMSADKAEDLLAQGGWLELFLDDDPEASRAYISPVANSLRGLTLSPKASTLDLNMGRFIAESTSLAKSISGSKSQTRNILLARDRLRAVLSMLLTPGLNKGIDEVCQVQLGVELSSASVGFPSMNVPTLHQYSWPGQAWCISADVSAARALAIVITLRALSIFEELSEAANTVLAFYTSSVPSAVGKGYQPPNLTFIARCWFDGSSEIRQAARLLFDATSVRLTDDETNATVESWQHQLPCLQPTIEKESPTAALALFICGHLASERYSLLSTSALTDICKSISIYLHDEHSIHRALAVDLCSRGFHVWQHYIDALEILRALFTLATSTRKETISPQNVGVLARSAILNISAANTPLFMTTLGIDILNPTSTEHRKSVLQILAFLIRKRPMVLYPNLPKLMEAVVKSLDPNSTSNRDAVLDTATEILGHVVKTYECFLKDVDGADFEFARFPTVDFHMSTQRLAVGTNEGAVIMYDLKTAIRLYVLEGHKKNITACSFSPDGRRLVTLSLEESVVLVWKVGSSISSFFYPGAPPRQGHAGSDPFKTLSFNVGELAKMSRAETLELVRFEWTADRSVKLKIRESVLTFST
ncbi:hypothetical protein VNI00_003580 [Paramarasmius palmivorus]|uniref:WD40 repeat-like protein n=1 Tax=Paramarasmius palmivorus TaxID=297713 RepID=A0AAW0DRE9_9AGAR